MELCKQSLNPTYERDVIKSVQSTLSHLQSPPSEYNLSAIMERVLVKIRSSWHNLIHNGCPICYIQVVNIKQAEATVRCLRSRGKY